MNERGATADRKARAHSEVIYGQNPEGTLRGHRSSYFHKLGEVNDNYSSCERASNSVVAALELCNRIY